MRPAKPRRPLFVRLTPELKEELDRLRSDDGLSINCIANRALREWLERYHAPVDSVRHQVLKDMSAARSGSAKGQRYWQRFQAQASKESRRRRKPKP